MGALFGILGSIVTGIFGMKQGQTETVNSAIKVMSDMSATDAQTKAAAASVLVAEAQSSSWLAKNWRPIMMMTFCGILISYWCGYVPRELLNPVMPPMIAEIFDLIKIGMGGYIGGRSLEKIVDTVSKAGILNKFMGK